MKKYNEEEKREIDYSIKLMSDTLAGKHTLTKEESIELRDAIYRA